MSVDTSREAVEREAKWVAIHYRVGAEMMLCLLAERDALRDRLTATEAQAVRDISHACEQRDDAWRTERAATEAADQYEAERDAALRRCSALEYIADSASRNALAAIAERDAACAEAERLRGVLEGIAEYWNGGESSAVDVAEECRYRAEVALGGGKP